MNDIHTLYRCDDCALYTCLLKRVVSKWTKKYDMATFVSYFKLHWIDSIFNKWQEFRTPVGYCHTNAALDAYEQSIGGYFCKHVDFSLKSVIEPFQKLINHESCNLMPIVSSKGYILQLGELFFCLLTSYL
jgi:hypothetical protein